MQSLIEDLRTECDALYAYVAPLPDATWEQPTPFWSWTVRDQILHLHHVDLCALTSVREPDQFQQIVAGRRADAAAGIELSQRVRERYGHLTPAEALARWRALYIELCDELAARPPKDRTAWFGPSMTLASMASARQMEVWAHGQNIYDLFGDRRQPTDRIRNICELGVKTYGWTFANRGEPGPGPAPRVELTAPSGEVWVWNPDAAGLVKGSAEGFALVVTQRRHLADSGLSCEGEAAQAWMLHAQCFAGPPSDGPAPGEVKVPRDDAPS